MNVTFGVGHVTQCKVNTAVVLQALKRASEGRTVISISHRVNAETGRIINI